MSEKNDNMSSIEEKLRQLPEHVREKFLKDIDSAVKKENSFNNKGIWESKRSFNGKSVKASLSIVDDRGAETVNTLCITDENGHEEYIRIQTPLQLECLKDLFFKAFDVVSDREFPTDEDYRDYWSYITRLYPKKRHPGIGGGIWTKNGHIDDYYPMTGFYTYSKTCYNNDDVDKE